MQRESAPSEKLQKHLARIGLGSRREIERWISAGRITVDGKPAKLGDRVTDKNRVCVDGKFVTLEKLKTRMLIYNKPEGEICTRHDPEGRPTVFEALPKMKVGKWINIGRLDVSSSGLLLFTNDGELANKMMHPSSQFEREYTARVLGDVTQAKLDRLLKGVALEDGRAKFESIKAAGGQGANRWYKVMVKEGRNRLVRRLWESQGMTISRLIRIRYGEVTLPRDLRQGASREINWHGR